jgi:protein phosphatase
VATNGQTPTLVLSDLHGNIDALWALDQELERRGEKYERIVVLGDLVDYGAAPLACVDWVRRHAHHVVRGNHDHALATATSCHSLPPLALVAAAMRELARPAFDAETLDFLRRLPVRLSLTIDGRRSELFHATPQDSLFGYVPVDATDQAWLDLIGPLADVETLVLVGHTHRPFTRRVGKATLANPGSLGQPRDGDPRGSYAVLRDGRVELRRLEYDVERAVGRVHKLPLRREYVEFLVDVLRSGALPV